jgi:glutaredoxin
MNVIKVYGADWCGDTQITRHQLDTLGVPYDYFDVDRSDEARSWVLSQNHGKQKTPTLDVDGTVLVEPSEEELLEVLKEKGLLDLSRLSATV